MNPEVLEWQRKAPTIVEGYLEHPRLAAQCNFRGNGLSHMKGERLSVAFDHRAEINARVPKVPNAGGGCFAIRRSREATALAARGSGAGSDPSCRADRSRCARSSPPHRREGAY